MPFTRRTFLKHLAAATILAPLAQTDWGVESPAAAAVRENLEALLDGRSMALDFRCVNARYDEEFRIQINAFTMFPVASCFKAMLVLYYFLNTPPESWDSGDSSPLYRNAVFSDNVATGLVLAEVAERVSGRDNAIAKFNDFLRITVGLRGGLYRWDWEGSPTAGMFDPRYAASEHEPVVIQGQAYGVDNGFTAADLGRCYDFLVRGEFFTQFEEMRNALRATQALLAIPARNYQSPIERVFPDGYMGKDGILPAADFAGGRVVNDAGVLSSGGKRYLLAFMSAGESESTAIDTLREVVRQIDVYQSSRT